MFQMKIKAIETNSNGSKSLFFVKPGFDNHAKGASSKQIRLELNRYVSPGRKARFLSFSLARYLIKKS